MPLPGQQVTVLLTLALEECRRIHGRWPEPAGRSELLAGARGDLVSWIGELYGGVNHFDIIECT